MYNSEVVYPGTRLSDRVFFGTGPAMIKGIAGQWSSYPLFHQHLFDEVKETINLFPQLFHGPVPTPMDDFLQTQFACEDIFEPLRQNHKNPVNFVKACHEKIDGLRILQFLKSRQALDSVRDEENLRQFFSMYFPANKIEKSVENLDFDTSEVNEINIIRNFLFEIESEMQKADAEKNFKI
jgi:hypothetical protein